MSSTIRKRKRDGVTSVQDDEVVKVKHKKPRRRKSQPQRNAEGQDEHAVPKLKEVSKFDELPSDAERKGSATESAQQTTSKKANRSKKKHDKRKKHAQGREQPQEKTQEQREEGQAEAEGQAREHRTGTSRKRKHAVSVDPTWNISQALGGRVIDADPVVTDDEKHLILAYPSALNVYATKSSSLVRSLPITDSNSKNTSITAYALSSTQPTSLYVATYKGILYLFDWVEGKKIGRWKLSTKVWGLAVSARDSSEGSEDVIYAREHAGDKWRISAHRLKGGSDASETESKTIYTSSSPITQFMIIRDGNLIVAASGKRLIVGELKSDTPPSLKEMKYVWREVDTPDKISSIDVRDSTDGSSASAQRGHTKSKPSGKDGAIIDVVLGHAQGSINIYDDLLNNLERQERQKAGQTTSHLSPRSMHWHREDVLSVKWTPDGNYILSGGLETVLVFWQLDTDSLDFLPHLSAAINSIVIAPSGTSYIIQLSDNSTMMLSSSELKPKVYVGGIQAEALDHRLPLASSNKVKINTGYQEDHPGNLQAPHVPATISGLNPSRLLLGVPSSVSPYPWEGASNGRPYLQTIDLATAHHISRQALTRTNTTNVNIGPELNKLVEPTVTFIRASHDGGWLATVDEWSPPRRDIEQLAVDEDELKSELRRRTEVFLKFWSWNSVHKQWELVTRVDGPHSLPADGQIGSGRILDVQTDPVSLGFSTVGEDGVIRIWTAKTRRRNNMVLFDENSQPLMEWSCHRTIRLGKVGSPKQIERAGHLSCRYPIITACLAYSFDGSVLAASQSSLILDNKNALGIIHFIDPNTGDIRRTQAGLYTGVLVSLAFVERYLVIIADGLMVWDTVQDCLSYGYSLTSKAPLSPNQKITLTHLAVDQSQGTFAVSFPLVESGKKHVLTRGMLKDARSQIAIFDPKTPIPLHTTSLPYLVTALVPLIDSTGYVLLDSGAELRIIRHKSSLSSLAISVSDKDISRGLLEHRQREGEEDGEREERATVTRARRDEEDEEEDIQPTQFRDGGATALNANNNEVDNDDDDGPPVIRQEQLTEIFDVGPAYSLPPLHDLFGQVAELFSRKPLSRRDNVAAQPVRHGHHA